MITGTIVQVDQDNNGAIRVWTNYQIDGVDVQSNYPQINGKSVYCCRYSAIQFAGMSNDDMTSAILADVQAQVNNLVTQQYSATANAALVSQLSSVVGQSASGDSTSVTVQNGASTMTINQDGTASVKTDKVIASQQVLP